MTNITKTERKDILKSIENDYKPTDKRIFILEYECDKFLSDWGAIQPVGKILPKKPRKFMLQVDIMRIITNPYIPKHIKDFFVDMILEADGADGLTTEFIKPKHTRQQTIERRWLAKI